MCFCHGCSDGSLGQEAEAVSSSIPAAESAASGTPNNIDECFEGFDALLSGEQKEALVQDPKALVQVYPALFSALKGWGLFEDSPLGQTFANMGIHEPTDVSEIVLTSYRDHLLGNPIHLEDRVLAVKNQRANVGKIVREHLEKQNSSNLLGTNSRSGH